MFYAHIVLAKKGPLARIWLAAHWDKKLTKAHVFETNIEQSVEGIMQPKVKLALRTSGHLLLGVVRIYSRKAKYLLADCNEAFVKIKMAFRPGMVDLPEEHREAAVNAITLPEVFHDFDTALPELNDVDIEAQFSINQTRADEITMREDYGSLSMSIHDDGFGDIGFDADASELVREGIDAHIDENLFAEELGREIDQTKEPVPGTSRDILGEDIQEAHLSEEGFGDEFGQPAAGLFEGDIFAEAPLQQQEATNLPPRSEDIDDDVDHFDVGAPSPMPSSIGSRPPSPIGGPEVIERRPTSPHTETAHGNIEPVIDHVTEAPPVEDNTILPTDQTTLLHNEEESFALAPVDASAYKGITKAKRKRKLIVDEVKNISGEEMKSQLANTSDIVTTLDLAPPTKRLMYWKETGGVEKLFALPSRDIPARCLFKSYQRHLLSRAFGVEDFSVLGAPELLALDQAQETESPTNKKGRKRKLPPVFEAPVELPEPPTPAPVAAPIPISETPQIPDLDATLVPEPEAVRDGELPENLTAVSIEMGASVNETLMPPPPTPDFASYPMMHMNGLGPLTPTMNHGFDMHDDFAHSGLTPADLHHGGATPSHHDIDNIVGIPNLPADQVSSILEEAGGVPLGYDILQHPPVEPEVEPSITPEVPPESRDSVPPEDMEFPVNVAEHQPGDEQMENETDEQFEERVLNKRAAQMFVAVRNRLQKRDCMYLSEMTVRNNRKQAAQKFYSLLVLKKFRALEITQNEPYGDILVTRGSMFDNPKL